MGTNKPTAIFTGFGFVLFLKVETKYRKQQVETRHIENEGMHLDSLGASRMSDWKRMLGTVLPGTWYLDSATMGSAEASPSKDPSKTIVAIRSWLFVLVASSTSLMYRQFRKSMKVAKFIQLCPLSFDFVLVFHSDLF